MLDYLEAQQQILDSVPVLPAELRALSDASGSFLAENLVAEFPIPRFDQSAVDGYAITEADLRALNRDGSVSLRNSGVIRAGDGPTEALAPGSCRKIFTGAQTPPATAAVCMIEDAREAAGAVTLRRPLRSGGNIRYKGEEFPEGAICLKAGTRLEPAAAGLATSMGFTQVPVYRRPRVTVIVTGSELVEPGRPLRPGQIYDSNAIALGLTLRELGINEVEMTRCPDEEAELTGRLKDACEFADLVLTSGGASVGDLDFVKPSVRRLGGTVHFDSVAIKPGKPTVFATVLGRPLIGLPGNPVSALVTFLLFARPALLRMMGSTAPLPVSLPARLSADVVPSASRTLFLRATLSESAGQLIATPVPAQDSHMLGGLATADGLMVIERGTNTVPVGAEVRFIPLSWRC